MIQMNFLIFGSLLKPEAYNHSPASNPASSKWLSGFCGGLVDAQARVKLFGHCYDQAWPRGRMFPGDQSLMENSFENHIVKFWNFPVLRFRSLARGYRFVAREILESSNIDAFITYNPYPWHVHPVRILRKEYGIPWISLNLDFDNVGVHWDNFLKQAGDADGHLFLSHWGYDNAPVERKIHLDSGVSSVSEKFGCRERSDAFTIVYLGKLSKSGGLEVLLQLPELIDTENVRFVIGGKGYPEADQKLKALAARDSRVEYLGFVEECEVQSLFERADIFLNPRDPCDVVNDMVFPSKIMEYLAVGKPVVSTWTKGLDPIYRGLLHVSESPSPEHFAQAIEAAINEPRTESDARKARIRSFIENSRLWSKQASRFIDFAHDVIEESSMYSAV